MVNAHQDNRMSRRKQSSALIIALALLISGSAKADFTSKQVTLWGGSQGWTDGKKSYGGNCQSRTHDSDEIQQVFVAYLKANAQPYTINSYSVRESGANCPYIDIVSTDLDKSTYQFIAYARTKEDVISAILDAPDADTIVAIAAKHGFKISSGAITSLNSRALTTQNVQVDSPVPEGRILKEAYNPWKMRKSFPWINRKAGLALCLIVPGTYAIWADMFLLGFFL
jgi:hypothetical protein